MEQEILEVIASVFKVNPATISSTIEVRGLDSWDSLKHMEFISALEVKFKIEMSFDEIVSIQTIGDIKNILSSKS
jgi:acyl carrier protein